MQRLSFYHHDDPRGLPDEISEGLYQKISKREKMPGFSRTQRGAFNTCLQGIHISSPLDVVVPKSQRGYPNLNQRPRERNNLAFRRSYNGWPTHKLPVVTRRTVQLYDMVVHPTLQAHESTMAPNYSVAAARAIRTEWPVFSKTIQEATSEEVLQMLLLPTMLDKGRLNFLLDSAQRDVRIIHTGGRIFSLRFLVPCTEEEEVFLAATVGETCVLQVEDNRKIRAFVNSWNRTGLQVKCLDEAGFMAVQNQPVAQELPELVEYHNQVREASFELSSTRFKVLETGAVDGWTACAPRWVEGKGLDYTGTPLIAEEQLNLLRSGRGFYNEALNTEQRNAVINILTHKAEQSFYSLIAPPGTGKTTVMLETMLQAARHHTEENNSSALILYACNTNLNARETAEKFAALGYPVENMVLLVGERYNAMNQGTWENKYNIPVQRITDFRQTDNLQVVFSTLGTMSKIGMSREQEINVFRKSPKMVFIDEISQVSAADVLAVTFLSGEPQAVVLAGDSMQLPPHTVSRTAAILYGLVTMPDLLTRHRDGYYEPDENYPTPRQDFGCTLSANQRADPFLINMVSTLYYSDSMVTSPKSWDHAEVTKCILRRLQESNELPSCLFKTPVTWLDFEGEAVRQRVTGSLSNVAEASLAMKVALQIGNVIGDEKVLVLTGYKAQVNQLLTIKPDDRTLRIASVDETQGLEAQVVVISLVRSEIGEVAGTRSAGFLKDPRRANVMLSRARNLIIVIGSAQHFWSSNCSHWMDFMKYWADIHN